MPITDKKNGSSRQVDHGVNILYETHMDLQADVLVGLAIRLGEAWSVVLSDSQDKLAKRFVLSLCSAVEMNYSSEHDNLS